MKCDFTIIAVSAESTSLHCVWNVLNVAVATAYPSDKNSGASALVPSSAPCPKLVPQPPPNR